MRTRSLASINAPAITVALGALVAAPLAAQTTSARASARATRAWTAPRTPWGDPDLEGVWTSDSVRGIPTERPEKLAGKRERRRRLSQ